MGLVRKSLGTLLFVSESNQLLRVEARRVGLEWFIECGPSEKEMWWTPAVLIVACVRGILRRNNIPVE